MSVKILKTWEMLKIFTISKKKNVKIYVIKSNYEKMKIILMITYL